MEIVKVWIDVVILQDVQDESGSGILGSLESA